MAPTAAAAKSLDLYLSIEDTLDGWTVCESTDDAEGWVVWSASSSDGDEASAAISQRTAPRHLSAPSGQVRALACAAEDEEESEESEVEELRPDGALAAEWSGRFLPDVAAAMRSPVRMRHIATVAAEAGAAHKKKVAEAQKKKDSVAAKEAAAQKKEAAAEAQKKKDLTRAARKNLRRQRTLEVMAAAEESADALNSELKMQ